MARLDRLNEKIMKLKPRRCYVDVEIDGNILALPVARFHIMIHQGKVQYSAIRSAITHAGNYAADIDAFLHLMKCHSDNEIHGELSHEGWRGLPSEAEVHEALLNDMTVGQKAKWNG